jgi:acetyltransferase
MDINPLIIDEQGAVAVDARVVVGAARQSAVGRHGPHAHLSIQPYPARYEQTWPLQGTSGEYLVRPIRPDDAQMLQSLVRAVSSESRYFRFASRITELPPAMLSRFTLIDYDREMALVAVRRDRIIGVARYIINPDPSSCEFGLLVADDYAGQGLGARLMYCLMDVAREQGLSEIQGLVLTDNARMLRLMHHLGFTVQPYPEEPEFRLVTHSL